MSDDIGFKIYAVIDGLKDSMSEASASVKTFADSAKKDIDAFSGVFKGLKEVTEAYLAALAVEKVEQFFDKFAESATQIERLSIAFGGTTSEVQELQFAMQATGGGDALQSMLSRLSVALEKAIDNAGPQRKAFEDMGISLKFLQDNANNVPGVLDALANSVKNLGGAQQNAADLTAIMGRSWAQNAGLLNQGAAGIKALGDAVEATGGVMNDVEVNQFEGMHQSITTMNAAFNGFGIAIAQAFGPAFTIVIDAITDFISTLNGGKEQVSGFRLVLAALAIPLDAIALAFRSIIAVWVEGQNVLEILGDVVKFTFIGMGKVIDDFRSGNVARMGADWDDTMVRMDAAVREHATKMKQELQDLGKAASAAASGVAATASGTPEGGDKPKAKPKKTQTTEEIAAAQAAATQEMQLAQEKVSFDEASAKQSLQTKKDSLDAQVAAGTISKQQEIAQLKSFSDEEYQIEDTALQQKENLYAEGTIEYQKALDARLLLAQKHNQELAKLDTQSAQVQAQQNKAITDTISKDFDQMLQGVLQGTQTWQQAMARLLDNLILSWIESEAKLVVKWAVDEATKTAATIAGNAERTASTAGAQAAGLATQAESATSSVGMSAGQAAASVYADVAAIPYVGWLLAPPAAAAAFVAVEAFGAGFSASGGFDIPSGVNPVTQLHQREMVLPADLADNVRNMTGNGSNGSGDVHLHVHATDSDSVKRLFMNNGQHIASALKNQMRNANPNLAGMKA